MLATNLACIDRKLISIVVTLGEEMQFDHVIFRDEESAAFNLAAIETRVARIVQRRRSVVNLFIDRHNHNPSFDGIPIGIAAIVDYWLYTLAIVFSIVLSITCKRPPMQVVALTNWPHWNLWNLRTMTRAASFGALLTRGFTYIRPCTHPRSNE